MEYISAKTIVTKTKGSQWFGIDYNMNIYKGCCHGCIYCDSRSDCYKIQDFDRVRVKEDALRIIRDDLRRKVKTGVVGTGAMSDPYNPVEQELELTRHALELIDAYGFGAAVATKSALLMRDMDILKGIMEHSPIICKVTVTTTDDGLAKKIEPHVSRPSERLALIESLRTNSIFAGILLMPVLPFLEDHEENILSIVKAAHEAGACFIYPAFGVTLRNNQREWYFDCLRELFPQEELVPEYIKTYGNSYKCTSPRARNLWRVFSRECERYGILYRMKDIIHAYKKNYEVTQLSLFD
ncbi:SPL family radical SAM protein [Lacrimispora saccharolytica]|uniref:Radical SAM domain protein n=1 Tax=Lacrimispora saccharolytica (strain ATCC 35040 / DSM 2544 / NRCC 2533 / WM1) TaxID=610130 RepID=D9R353_LACSW|nr:radical SAM protein [Lacrimispora saccharolytica]ADL04802.1 Radical SAM domain protein [[Clostridium] saccharolyticum WM1]QRV21998.1 radical SAM protein [Lacrimispora saccharolytica]